MDAGCELNLKKAAHEPIKENAKNAYEGNNKNDIVVRLIKEIPPANPSSPSIQFIAFTIPTIKIDVKVMLIKLENKRLLSLLLKISKETPFILKPRNHIKIEEANWINNLKNGLIFSFKSSAKPIRKKIVLPNNITKKSLSSKNECPLNKEKTKKTKFDIKKPEKIDTPPILTIGVL